MNDYEHIGSRKQGEVGEGFNAQFRGFINPILSEHDKAQFEHWLSLSDIEETMAAYCTDGVVLSVKIDVRSGGYLASATQRREKSVNAGLAVTARASQPGKALHRLLFMLETLPADGWEKGTPLADPDRW